MSPELEAVFFTTAPRLSSCKSCCILSHLRPQGGKEQREREERRACLEKTWEVEERKEDEKDKSKRQREREGEVKVKGRSRLNMRSE